MLSRLNRHLAVARLAPPYTRFRYPHLFAHVSHFCLFVGHGRSGSSLVGALLNAHPSIVLSNELDALAYLDRKLTRLQLFNLIFYLSRRQARKGSRGGGGYTYAVPKQWQGKHDTIHVIGDRKAGATAIQIFRHPELIGKAEIALNTPLRFVHAVRNPFDVLTTTFLKGSRRPGESSTEYLAREIGLYFDRCTAVVRVMETAGEASLRIVFHEDLVSDVRRVLGNLCRFLGVEPDSRYLADCAEVVSPRARTTRKQIEWPRELIDLVESRIPAYSWLTGYSFDE